MFSKLYTWYKAKRNHPTYVLEYRRPHFKLKFLNGEVQTVVPYHFMKSCGYNPKWQDWVDSNILMGRFPMGAIQEINVIHWECVDVPVDKTVSHNSSFGYAMFLHEDTVKAQREKWHEYVED